MAANRVFKALANPTRREILSLLGNREMTAGELAECFSSTWPTLSHHFNVLREAGLIRSRRDGQQIWYALNTTVVRDVVTWATSLVEEAPEDARE